MKRNHYIFLGMALVALPSLAQVQPQSKDTTMTALSWLNRNTILSFWMPLK